MFYRRRGRRKPWRIRSEKNQIWYWFGASNSLLLSMYIPSLILAAPLIFGAFSVQCNIPGRLLWRGGHNTEFLLEYSLSFRCLSRHGALSQPRTVQRFSILGTPIPGCLDNLLRARYRNHDGIHKCLLFSRPFCTHHLNYLFII